jgi:hypothetical protein
MAFSYDEINITLNIDLNLVEPIEIKEDATRTANIKVVTNGHTITIGKKGASTIWETGISIENASKFLMDDLKGGGINIYAGAGVIASNGATVEVSNIDTYYINVGNGVNATGNGTTVNVKGKVLTGDIHPSIYARDGSVVTVGGTVTSQSGNAVNAGSGAKVFVYGIGDNVTDNTEGTVSLNLKNFKGVYANGSGAVVDVGKGGITSNSDAVLAEEGATVNVSGPINTGWSGVFTESGGKATVVGNIKVDSETGLRARGRSSITVTGNVSGCRNAADADGNSVIKVTGDITGTASGVRA